MEIYSFIIQFFTMLLGIFFGICAAFILIKYTRILREKHNREGQSVSKEIQENQPDSKVTSKRKEKKISRGKRTEISLKDRIRRQNSVKSENCYLDGLDDLDYEKELKIGKQKEEEAYRYIDRERKNINK